MAGCKRVHTLFCIITILTVSSLPGFLLWRKCPEQNISESARRVSHPYTVWAAYVRTKDNIIDCTKQSKTLEREYGVFVRLSDNAIKSLCGLQRKEEVLGFDIEVISSSGVRSKHTVPTLRAGQTFELIIPSELAARLSLNVSLAIIASSRLPSYLSQTISSLVSIGIHFFQDRKVFFDGPASKYPDDVSWFSTLFEFVPRVDDTILESLKKKAALNYVRALHAPSRVSRGLLVVEDDIVCSPSFATKFARILADIELSGVSKYVLALYSSIDFGIPLLLHASSGLLLGSSSYVLYTGENIWFYGTQATYFPSSIIHDINDAISVFSYAGSDGYDMAITKFCEKHSIPIFVSPWSLVQHIGKKTTGLGSHQHAAAAWDNAVGIGILEKY